MSQYKHNNELVQLQAHELAQRIRLRQVSCREVMQAHLEQIERFNRRSTPSSASNPKPFCWPKPTSATPSWRVANTAAGCTACRTR